MSPIRRSLLRRSLLASLFLTVPVVAVRALDGDHDHGSASGTDDTTPAEAGFQRLATLAGEWVKVDGEGRPTDEVVSVFRTTAMGSAVVETLFPGSEHEMLTVYHTDGADLVLTHYCMEKNQPRMRAKTIASDRIDFECTGDGGSMDEDDRHMHRGVFTWTGPDRMKVEWFRHTAGEHDYTASFDVARR